MASLGGARAVQTACESVLHDRQAPLEIKFRPDDPLARGLCAERVDVNGLVLRVSRPRASTALPRVDADRARRPRLPLRVPRRLSAHPRRDPPQTRPPCPASRPSPSPDPPPRTRIPREEEDLRDIPSRVSSRTDPRTTPSASANARRRRSRVWPASVRSCCPRHPPATGRMITFAPPRARFADGASARGRRKDFKAERDFAERSVPPWLGEPSAESGCSREDV